MFVREGKGHKLVHSNVEQETSRDWFIHDRFAAEIQQAIGSLSNGTGFGINIFWTAMILALSLLRQACITRELISTEEKKMKSKESSCEISWSVNWPAAKKLTEYWPEKNKVPAVNLLNCRIPAGKNMKDKKGLYHHSSWIDNRVISCDG